MLRWPEQAKEIEACRRRKLPRMLLVAPHAEPPLSVDPLEDWVRAPVDDADLQARWDALTARVAPRKPVIDGQVLHFRGRRLLLAAGEADLVRVLLASYRTVVSREDLAARIWPAGGIERRNALDVRILRTRRRLAPLGLAIKTVWRRGYLLDVTAEGEVV
ncbi:winged helix-turn-helix domain-containing protein [Streptomyces sp. NPDC007205]|uniref:winged helix-turn-helix domain-containing protein n=1 Tax=Streptomyces sp. NPDC007205 TaxID=3154316 RepID=UPI0033D7982B